MYLKTYFQLVNFSIKQFMKYFVQILLSLLLQLSKQQMKTIFYSRIFSYNILDIKFNKKKLHKKHYRYI